MRQPMPLSCGHLTIIRHASLPLWNGSCIDSLVWFLIYQPGSLVYCGRTSCHKPYKRKFSSLESLREYYLRTRKSCFNDPLGLVGCSAIFSNFHRTRSCRCHPKIKCLHIVSPFVVNNIIAWITIPSTSLHPMLFLWLSSCPPLCFLLPVCTCRSSLGCRLRRNDP